MAKLRAAVLAAGRGVRMGGETPKALIPVRTHEPLLYYLLKGLQKAGVRDLLVVTGYRPDAIESYVTQHWSDAAQFVFNARYASWGNFHSVRVAVDQSPGFDLLVVNSDVVVHPQVFTRVIDSQGELVLAVERRADLDQEDMRVRLRGGRVVGIGKDLKRAQSHGEYDGVSLLRPSAARLYADLATQLEWRNDTELYYEDVYARMLGQVEARPAFVAPGEYAEVDEWSDMEDASAVIQRHLPAWEMETEARDEATATRQGGGPQAGARPGAAGGHAATSETA